MIIFESKMENYCIEFLNENIVIVFDVIEEKGGKGQYFRFYDLLCVLYVLCFNIIIRMVLECKNIKYEKVIVKVDLDRSDENKIKFFYDIDIIGDIFNEIKEFIINMVRKCLVRKILLKEIEFEIMQSIYII